MTRLEWAIAWRYLRSRRQSALLSFISMIAVGGVIVGVSALIVIIGVMNGLQIDLREKILLGSPDVTVLTYGESLRMTQWRQALDSVAAQPGVVAVGPFVLTDAMAVNSAGYAHGVLVRGMPASGADVANVTGIRDKAVEGDFRFATGDGTQRGAVLGSVLAARMSARIGDTITVFTPAGMRPEAILFGAVPAATALIVTGVFESGMYEYDSRYVFVDLGVGQQMAGLGADVSGLEVKVRDRLAARDVAAHLDAVLGYPYRTEDWTAQNASLFRALRLEKFAMAVILLLIVVVAAFNIVSTLTMVVRDKTREIGILKAMGLTSHSVRNVFLLQGLVIGLVGTSIGLAIGVGVAVALDKYRLIPLEPEVYFIDHLPSALQVGDTVLIVVASVLIATLATLYPARQASRLTPVEAIRDE